MPVAGRRVVVIGSGATAITLLPALVDEGAARVTMLQRSPSYVASLPSRDVVADGLRAVLPDAVAHRLVRGKNVLLSTAGYQVLRRRPEARPPAAAAPGAAAGCPTATPSTPTSRRATTRGTSGCASPPTATCSRCCPTVAPQVVTGTIERFERDGIRLTTGELLEADVVVTATGLQMEIGGGAELVVDGEPVDLSRGHVYKGLMLSDVPNVAMAVGYTNASWTLRADLSARWFCSLLRHLDRHGLSVATPALRRAGGGGAAAARPHLGLRAAGRAPAAAPGASTGRGGWCRATSTTWRSPGWAGSTTATSSCADPRQLAEA